ncbi:MAG: RNA polymerase sigma factor [Gammaproteobacteria bacterium]|nr:MAG: RNA polymerase sigma factor [Gammaproteobacteria bacterium]
MTRLSEITVPEALLARARAGNEAARGAIYAALAPATFALIRRLVGQRAVSEDLFQDTMMSFYERLAQFRHEAPIGAWLRQIAISRCLMYLRSPWRRLSLSLDAADFGVGSAPALMTPARREECCDVERALAALTPTARAVVWMYEVEGYSHQEIASAFGRTVSFSKSQLSRAHRRLRAWFEPQGSRPSCNLI